MCKMEQSYKAKLTTRNNVIIYKAKWITCATME